jgi:hypothetical protein
MADKLTRNGIRPTQGELLQDVILKGRSRDGSGHDNGQFRIHSQSKKKNSLSCIIGPPTLPTEVVHRRSRFVVSRRGIREIVGCTELRSIP